MSGLNFRFPPKKRKRIAFVSRETTAVYPGVWLQHCERVQFSFWLDTNRCVKDLFGPSLQKSVNFWIMSNEYIEKSDSLNSSDPVEFAR